MIVMLDVTICWVDLLWLSLQALDVNGAAAANINSQPFYVCCQRESKETYEVR